MTNYKDDILPLYFEDQFREIRRKIMNETLDPKKVSVCLHEILKGFEKPEDKRYVKVDVSEVRAIKSAISSRNQHLIEGQPLKKHPNGGGLVPKFQDEDNPEMPFIAETNYIGPKAVITGNVRMFGENIVRGRVRMSGDIRIVGTNRILGDIWAHGKILITGNNRISENATLYGDSIWIAGNVHITDNAWITGHSCIFGKTLVTDDSWVFGRAKVADCTIREDAKVGGDFKAANREILSGVYM